MFSIELVLLLVLVFYFNDNQRDVIGRGNPLLKAMQRVQYGILNLCSRAMRILANDIVNGLPTEHFTLLIAGFPNAVCAQQNNLAGSQIGAFFFCILPAIVNS